MSNWIGNRPPTQPGFYPKAPVAAAPVADRLASVVIKTILPFPVQRLQALALNAGGQFEVASCLLPQHENRVRALALETAAAGKTTALALEGLIGDPSVTRQTGPLYLGPTGLLVAEPPEVGFVQQIVAALDPNNLLLTFSTAGASGGGGGGGRYTHQQIEPATTWDVHHNLNGYPPVTFVDTAGEAFEPDYRYLDANTIRASLIAATSGLAHVG